MVQNTVRCLVTSKWLVGVVLSNKRTSQSHWCSTSDVSFCDWNGSNNSIQDIQTAEVRTQFQHLKRILAAFNPINSASSDLILPT